MKAALVTTFLFLLGLSAVIRGITDWKTTLPILIFYAVITINTFFSIKCFSAIIPSDSKLQWLVDAALILLYILMSLNLNSPLHFAIWTSLLFSVAVIKYALLLHLTDYLTLLRYKILIDSLGTLAAVSALAGIAFGYAFAALWLWTVLFCLVNLYIFFIKPLYELPE